MRNALCVAVGLSRVRSLVPLVAALGTQCLQAFSTPLGAKTQLVALRQPVFLDLTIH